VATAARRRALEYGDPVHPTGSSIVAAMRPDAASIRVFASLDVNAAEIELAYRPIGATAETAQVLPVELEHCHFGGGRVWVRCECGRRAAVMYGPAFTCVHCSGLVYPSTRMTEADRMVGRAVKLRRRLHDDWSAYDIEFAMRLGIPMPLPNKPRGAWFARYFRIEEQIAEFERRALSLNRSHLARLVGALR